MRIVQLNVWMGKIDKNLYNLLKGINPDILCLQEVIDYPKPSFLFTTLSDIIEATSHKNLYSSPVMSFGLSGHNASYGNAVLSRWEIDDSNTIFTNLKFKDNFQYSVDDYNIRNFQHATINIEGKKLNVLNHHGYHVPKHKDGNDETKRQMQIIADYIDTLEGPIILAGDFNLAPHSESLDIINQKLINLSSEHKLTTTRNELTSKSEVCDYIFVSSDIKVNNFKKLEQLVSDHAALVLDFDIIPQ